jgi:Lrp/AsnC family transcriptional regulator of ectoine degradation
MTDRREDAAAKSQQPAMRHARRRTATGRQALDGRIALDRIDLQILAILQREGRISKAELAERVGLSPSTCHERMRRLQKQKAILSYHANVNLRAIAHTQTFFVEVTLKTHRAYDFRRFESFIAKVPEIVECHALGGGIDYLIKVVARDVDAYQLLVDHLLEAEIGIERYFTYVVTKGVKSLTQFSVENLIDQAPAEERRF